MSVSTKSTKIDKDVDKNVGYNSGWQRALREANQEYLAAQLRMRSLRRSIKLITAKIKAGEAWPGTQLNGRDSERQHSV
jgi:hypothetical protein